MRFYDAHNHLQDERLRGLSEAIFSELPRLGVVKVVVNGSCEADWPDVLQLARESSLVLPSFGYHPWYVRERTPQWQQTLLKYLDTTRSGIGEVGLDRWIKDYDLPLQEEMFVWQLRAASERNLPLSIHCLQAWGKLLEILRREPSPACGFLLHSYGGSVEMIEPFAELGAYFSLSGYFAHERKTRQREAFRRVPSERLLIETDAPDMTPPDEYIQYRVANEEGNQTSNHPGNLIRVYEFASKLLGQRVEQLAAQVEDNFRRLFQPIL